MIVVVVAVAVVFIGVVVEVDEREMKADAIRRERLRDRLLRRCRGRVAVKSDERRVGSFVPTLTMLINPVFVSLSLSLPLCLSLCERTPSSTWTSTQQYLLLSLRLRLVNFIRLIHLHQTIALHSSLYFSATHSKKPMLYALSLQTSKIVHSILKTPSAGFQSTLM